VKVIFFYSLVSFILTKNLYVSVQDCWRAFRFRNLWCIWTESGFDDLLCYAELPQIALEAELVTH